MCAFFASACILSCFLSAHSNLNCPGHHLRIFLLMLRHRKMSGTPKGELPPCMSFYDSVSCGKNHERCEWHEVMYICNEHNNTIECGRLHIDEHCTAQPHCAFDHHTNGCYSKGAPVPCNRHYTLDGCERTIDCKSVN